MTEAYQAIENGVKAILDGMTDYFNTGTITQGDYSSVLDKDSTKGAGAVLTPGDFEDLGGFSATSHKLWIVNLDLFQKYKPGTIGETAALAAPASFNNFKILRGAVIETLEKYPTLNGVDNVTSVVVSGDGDPTYVIQRGTTIVTHITQSLRVAVTKLTPITGGEYV